MKWVTVFRGAEKDGLTTIEGYCRNIQRKRQCLRIIAEDGGETLIPWTTISRVVVTGG